MRRIVIRVSVSALLMSSFALSARAQTPPAAPRETGAYVSLGIGGQPQTRSFSSSGTFTSFNEAGRYDVNQNIGAGMLFDVAGGYHFNKRLSAGASIWNARAKSAVSAAAAMPDPAFFGRATTVTATNDSDLRQST